MESRTTVSESSWTRPLDGTIVTKHPLDGAVLKSDYDGESLSPTNTKSLTFTDDEGDFDDEDEGCKTEAGAASIFDETNDLSVFEAVLSPDCQDVWLKSRGYDSKKKKLQVNVDDLASSDDTLSQGFDSPEEDIEDSILGQMDPLSTIDPIPEYSLEEELQDERSWRSVTVGGVERRIDMKVIDPYKRVLSHGGYVNSGCHNAIIVFSACFLPHRSRVDYNYVMDNLFSYVVSTLEQLVTDDYVLVYLHGGSAKDSMPSFAWMKRCYQMLDRKLRKNLKTLYLVHPTFWLKTLVAMTRPFVSSKFSKKLRFIGSLSELQETLPLESASIPERVYQYDRIKQSISVEARL